MLIAAGLALVSGAAFFLADSARASPAPTHPDRSPQSEACLTCHNLPEQQRPMPGGEILPLTIEREPFRDSAHGALDCTACHTRISAFPHPELTARSVRDFSLEMYTVCQSCHQEQYDRTLDSVHMRAVAAGNTNAAICTDCHDPHTQPRITGPSGALLAEARLHIPETCARCHSTIYETYSQSVHGQALTEEGNTDVPTCIDCHGVHNIGDPTTEAFRLKSPQICANCHTDPEIMDRYGISTQVLSTYVTDFHGTTVVLFERLSPDQATNKPVCFDCHGVHNIMRVDDPVYGLEMRQNLLQACQRCHPGASDNFPDAWMSHFIPSPERNPIVYYVNLFYKFFIPGVLVPMTIFVISDIVRRAIDARKGAKRR
jgi:hypothetical protein